jgi:hypothetical protein
MMKVLDAAESVRRAVRLAEAMAVPSEVRRQRFNDTTGVFGYISNLGRTGANLHPDRCACQGNDPTPHKHRGDGSCARCLPCKAYVPHDWPAAPAFGDKRRGDPS